MDCRDVKELLDAYALGAAARDEARALEEHARDCVRCWEDLNQAQRTAALLALSLPLQPAPAGLRERILAQAQREVSRPRSALRRPDLLRRGWPAAAAAFAAAAAAALAFAAFLQVQVADLRDDNRTLERQVSASAGVLEQQRQLMAVFAAPDVQELVLQPAAGAEALGVYYWSPGSREGFFLGSNLPALREGQVYQVWLMMGADALPVAAIQSGDGTGQAHMDLATIEQRPEGIGVSVENAAGADRPSSEPFLFASFSGE